MAAPLEAPPKSAASGLRAMLHTSLGLIPTLRRSSWRCEGPLVVSLPPRYTRVLLPPTHPHASTAEIVLRRPLTGPKALAGPHTTAGRQHLVPVKA